MSSSSREHINVAVRLRPLSTRERERGDSEVWEVVGENQVGVREGLGVTARVKYAFDTVFNGTATNKEVFELTSQAIVRSSLDGFNGTIFAYGVTSSGKTHTIMGGPTNLGIVPQAMCQVFDAVEATPERTFLLRLSMMEIYNEVLNDLLDPGRTNLRLREDPRRGFFVEGITQETLVSAQHALSVVAAGETNRKVAATAFNEDSSRSHTIIRLTIESSEQRQASHSPSKAGVTRLAAVLNLIDLAGSESARAVQSKQQQGEGSYINKSLLTLGTVIAKLSEGNAAHIPFRDSKLTRLLQASLTGNGARVAIICTITPASKQAEETHNTLKFATRAKKIEIAAQRNEIMDHTSLIAHYERELATLRAQLGASGGSPAHDPMHPDMRTLRERLEEEHQALLQAQRDNAALEVRVRKLLVMLGQHKQAPGAAAEADGLQAPPTANGFTKRSASWSAGSLASDSDTHDAVSPPLDPEAQADFLREQAGLLAQQVEQQDAELAALRAALAAPRPPAPPDDLDAQIRSAEQGFLDAQSSVGTSSSVSLLRSGSGLDLDQPGGLTQEQVARFVERLGAQVETQLREATAENAALRKELARVEAQTNQLQGYGLDAMSAEELSGLVAALTQAVERVRITVQLRRLASTQQLTPRQHSQQTTPRLQATSRHQSPAPRPQSPAPQP